MPKNRINLIPPELQPSLKISREFIPVAIFAAFLLYATTSAASLHFMMISKSASLARLKSENKVRHEKIDGLNSQQISRDAETEKFKSLQNVLSHKSYWADIFKELSVLTPEDVWLTTLGSSGEAAAKKLILRGEATSQKKVADFFSVLEKSQHFSEAVVIYSELDAKTAPELFKFELAVPFPNPSTSGDL